MGAPPGWGSTSSLLVLSSLSTFNSQATVPYATCVQEMLSKVHQNGLSGLSSAGCVTLGKSPSLSEPRGPGPALHLW